MKLLTERLNMFVDSPLWAILPDYFANLMAGSDAMALRSEPPKAQDRIMLIPVKGVLSRGGEMGTSYGLIHAALDQAANDPSIKRIVLAVDSPGGEVRGLPETAAHLAQVAKIKPVSAMVEGMAASAAYWLTSQASDITVTPSGEVGCVGAKILHADISQMLANSGVKITELHAGDFKTETSPFRPLTDAATQDMQARLNSTHLDFMNDVSKGRGPRVSAEIKAARFGEGRMFDANTALGHGLADRVQSPRDFYRALQSPQEEHSTRRARLALMRAQL